MTYGAYSTLNLHCIGNTISLSYRPYRPQPSCRPAATSPLLHERVRPLALLREREQPALLHLRRDLVVRHVVVVEGKHTVGPEHPVELCKDALRLAQKVEYVVEQDHVDAAVGQSGVTVGEDGLYHVQSIAPGTVSDHTDRKRMDVQGVHPARGTHQPGNSGHVPSRTASVVQHRMALLDASLRNDLDTRPEEVAEPVHQRHETEAHVGEGSVRHMPAHTHRIQ